MTAEIGAGQGALPLEETDNNRIDLRYQMWQSAGIPAPSQGGAPSVSQELVQRHQVVTNLCESALERQERQSRCAAYRGVVVAGRDRGLIRGCRDASRGCGPAYKTIQSNFADMLFRARDREAFVVQQAFNELEGFEVLRLVEAMARAGVTGTQDRELCLPEAQDVSLDADGARGFADIERPLLRCRSGRTGLAPFVD